MTDDFDVEAALEGARTTHQIEGFVPIRRPNDTDESHIIAVVIGQLEPYIEAVRQIVTDPALIGVRIQDATPVERAEIARLRAVLQALE